MSGAEYRIADLAHHSGATVRTIRAYQDRRLLPPARAARPGQRVRIGVAPHQAASDRGSPRPRLHAASIKELLEAWDAGRGLGGVLGLVVEVQGPWTDEEAARVTRAELAEKFGGSADEESLADAVELGVLERIPGREDEFLVPSPQELAAAAELHAAGVPLSAISGRLKELRGQVEHIAAHFLEFTAEHVFARFPGHRPPTDAEAAEAAVLVRRLP